MHLYLDGNFIPISQWKIMGLSYTNPKFHSDSEFFLSGKDNISIHIEVNKT